MKAFKLGLCRLISFLLPALLVAQDNVISNTAVWYDTAGNPIRASMGGHITQVGDTYYWLGNDQESQGRVYMYASKTLGSSSWVPTGTLAQGRVQFLKPNGETSGGLGSNLTLIRSPTTSNFVIVAKGSGLSFYESETVEGPYTIRNELSRRDPPMNLHTNNYKIGGMSTFQEGDKAYVITSRRWLGDPEIAPNSQRFAGIYQLTPNFLDVEEEIAWVPNNSREAMWLFKKGDLYYMTGSHTAGWTPSACYYRTAPSLSGPWPDTYIEIEMDGEPQPEPHYAPQNADEEREWRRLVRSQGTQHRWIMKVGDQWIFGGDRYPTIEPVSYPDSSLGDARMYRICPVIWDGDHPVVQWQSVWTIDAAVSPFNAWANLNFVENGPDQRSGDQTADEDDDGLVNLVEFAIGGNPRSGADLNQLPALGSNQDGLYFEYPRRLEVDSGLLYQAQFTEDLASDIWTDWVVPNAATVPMNADFEKVIYPLPSTGSSERFYRLQILEP
jgi:hypothetical protein